MDTRFAAGKHRYLGSNKREVYSWGEGGNGQLGHGSPTNNEKVPRLVSSLKTKHILRVCAGAYHSIAISGAFN